MSARIPCGTCNGYRSIFLESNVFEATENELLAAFVTMTGNVFPPVILDNSLGFAVALFAAFSGNLGSRALGSFR